VVIALAAVGLLAYDVVAFFFGSTISEVIYWDWSVRASLWMPTVFLGALSRHLAWPFLAPPIYDGVRMVLFVAAMVIVACGDWMRWWPTWPPLIRFLVGFLAIGPLWTIGKP
jgi:hypothetical protein